MKKPTPGEDLPALFRSLRPDSATFQASVTAAALEAEQRWPLFKAISPHTPEPAPALSDEERQRWRTQEKPGATERKPALARIGVNDKLTKSLSKMSGLENNTAAAPRLAVLVAQNRPGRELPQRSREPLVSKPVENPSVLFSKAAPTVKPDVEIKPVGLGLFGKKTMAQEAPEALEPAAVAEPAAQTVVVADDSLANIFGRLREKDEPVRKPAVKKLSFLGRLGKK